MLKCRICGFKTASRITMNSHLSSAHRTMIVQSHDDSAEAMSSSNLSNFFDGSCDTESHSVEDQFSGGGGSFGGGGSSGSWDDSSSSSSSDSGSSSCDSGSCGGD